jgi:tetratricopeptide (TPR) repeat protein
MSDAPASSAVWLSSRKRARATACGLWPNGIASPARLACTLALLLLIGAAAQRSATAAEDPEALYRQGQALLEQRDRAAAEQVFQQLVREAPQHLRGRLALGRLQLDHSPSEALATADAARVLDPNSEEVYWLRGRALEALGKLPDAAESYRQVIRINPRRTEANQRLRNVLRLLRSQQTRVQEAAERFYATPNLATLSLFGRFLLDEATPQQAVAELEDARVRVPTLPEVNLWIARAQQKAGSLDGEIEAYQRFLVTDPNAAGVRLLLAEHLQEAGRFRLANAALLPFDSNMQLTQDLDSAEQARLAYLRSRIALGRVDLITSARFLADAARQGLDPVLTKTTYLSDLTLEPDEAALWQGYAEWLGQTQAWAAAVDAWEQAGLLDASRRSASRKALTGLAAPGRAPEAAQLALARLDVADGQTQDALKLTDAVPSTAPLQRRRWLVRGLAYRAAGDLSHSVDAFVAYVTSSPDAKEISRARGILFWETGDRAAAIAAWHDHPEALDNDPALLARIALYLQTAGDAAQEQQFRERLATIPGVTPANRVRLGELYLAVGRTKDALAQWDAALAQNPRDVDLLLRVARQRYAQGDMVGGTARLLQANALRPVPIDLALTLADYWRTQGRLGEALALYWQVYQVRPQEPHVRSALPEVAANVGVDPQVRRVAAAVAIETGRRDLGASLLRTLLDEQPNDVEARSLLADLYTQQGRQADADALLKAAHPPLGPDEQLRALARVQRQAGNTGALADTLRRLAALEPNNPALARERGVLLVQLGRFDEAEPVLAPLAPRSAGDADLELAEAQVDLARGRYVPAEQEIKQVLAAHPDLSEAHRQLQRLYQQQGRWEDLGHELEYQVARDPRSPELREATIAMFLRASKPALAKPHYEALRSLDPQRARAFARNFQDRPVAQ